MTSIYQEYTAQNKKNCRNDASLQTSGKWASRSWINIRLVMLNTNSSYHREMSLSVKPRHNSPCTKNKQLHNIKTAVSKPGLKYSLGLITLSNKKLSGRFLAPGCPKGSLKITKFDDSFTYFRLDMWCWQFPFHERQQESLIRMPTGQQNLPKWFLNPD